MLRETLCSFKNLQTKKILVNQGSDVKVNYADDDKNHVVSKDSIGMCQYKIVKILVMF